MIWESSVQHAQTCVFLSFCLDSGLDSELVQFSPTSFASTVCILLTVHVSLSVCVTSSTCVVRVTKHLISMCISPGGGKVLPQRPPLAKPTPGRPPQPRRDSVLRNSTLQSQQPNNPRRSVSKKAPVLPPRPNPGHRLYNRYTVRNSNSYLHSDWSGDVG